MNDREIAVEMVQSKDRSTRPGSLVAVIRNMHGRLLRFQKRNKAIYPALVCMGVFWLRATGVLWFKSIDDLPKILTDPQVKTMQNAPVGWDCGKKMQARLVRATQSEYAKLG